MNATRDLDAEGAFNDRLSDAMDVENEARTLRYNIISDDIPGATALAETVLNHIENASSVETEADLDGNIENAKTSCKALIELLKKATWDSDLDSSVQAEAKKAARYARELLRSIERI